ncbi:MarR family transcriptional regulator [Chlorogloeopsis sp. ULAP02]|uniref:MarR family transcriptional regulator n=1 Tax=Chlorogloeopsis sp. ULAP02 TaxID=3107926 RepID=UPI00313740E8
MEQKRAKKGTVQADILNLLKNNPGQKFTFNEVAQKLGISHGSTSGTLSVLWKNGVISKTNDHPAKYFYNSDITATSPNEKLDNKCQNYPESSEEQERSYSGLSDFENKIKQEIEEIEQRCQELKKTLEILEIRRETLRGTLKILDETIRLEKERL